MSVAGTYLATMRNSWFQTSEKVEERLLYVVTDSGLSHLGGMHGWTVTPYALIKRLGPEEDWSKYCGNPLQIT